MMGEVKEISKDDAWRQGGNLNGGLTALGTMSIAVSG
jgi:hypothetical protein